MDDNKIRQPAETKPRFFYGYIVVAVALFVLVVVYGLYNSFGVFFKPLLTEFGWTRAMTSGAFSLSMIIYGVLGMVMGGLADRFGPRVVVAFCGFFLGLGCLLISQVNALWQLYLFYGVIIGVGMSGNWVPLLSTVARWFVKRRSMMTGIVASGLGIGTLIAPLVISRLIAAYDWRLTSVILGSAILVVLVIIAQFLRRAPTQKGQLPYGSNAEKQQTLKLGTEALSLKEAVHTSQFWIFFILLFCHGFCVLGVQVHIVPHAIDSGISSVSAANTLAIIGALSILGNFVLGIVGDRIGSRQIYIIGSIIMSVALFWLVPARDAWMLYIFAVVFGFSLGAGVGESTLIARLFGLSSHGLIFGVVHLGFNFGAAVGPFVVGYIFDLTGSYQVAFMICAALGVTSFILAAILKPTKKLGGSI